MASLCPACGAKLQADIYECPHCRLEFKNPETLVRRALLIPGGAFFYTGHVLIGFAHALVDVVLLCYLGIFSLVAAGLVGSARGAAAISRARPATFVMVAVFAALFALHKWVTIKIANSLVRDYIPLS